MSTPMTNIKTLNTKAIRIDGGTQSRVQINNETVAEYAEAIKEGDKFPPVIVFFDGAEHHLGDGFHRYHGHNAAGKTSIEADVRTGTLRDAILYSLGANKVHGLRPSNDDKRKAVGTMLADAEWSQLSDREIAQHCGCSRMLVGRMRNPEPAATPRSVTSDTSSPAEQIKSGLQGAPASVTSDAKPVVATTEKQRVAEQNAQDAHGEDDPIALLEVAYKETAELRALLDVAEADDKQAEVIKFKRIADVAVRRQNELMETVNAREGDLKRQANWLRRIGVAMDEEDNSKLAAKVEAMARSLKVAA